MGIKSFTTFIFFTLVLSSSVAQIVCDTERKIVSTDSHPLEGAGALNGVDIYGNYAIVGGFGNSEHGENAGIARVFRKEGDAWIHSQNLFSTDISEGDRFGRSVAIWGDYAVVGAPFDDIAGLYAGSVYIYKREGAFWIQTYKLSPPDGLGSHRFGYEVDIWGDYIVVGAPYDIDQNVVNTGSAYFYHRNGEEWSFMNKVYPDGGTGYGEFGGNISMKDNQAIIGSENNNDDGNNTGAAYVFQLQDAIWTYSQELLPTNGTQGMSYGYAVAISDDIAVVGAYQDVVDADNKGSVYVYRHIGNTWVEEQKIVAEDVDPVISFGVSVASDTDRIVIGASGANSEFSEASGANFIYDFDGSNWVLQGKIAADDAQISDYYGTSVAMQGDYIITGAFGEDSNGGEGGAAYINYLACYPMCTTISSPADGSASIALETDISWFEVEAALSYVVSVGTAPGGNDIIDNLDVGNATVVSVPAGLAEDTYYYVNITPYNDSGNSISCIESSFTTALIPMTAVVGADATVLCHEPLPTEDFITNFACDDVEVTVSTEMIAGDCENEYTLIRTYLITDGCTTVTDIQTLEVVDITGPVFSNVPANVWIECGDDLPDDLPIAMDQCDSEPLEVVFEDSNTGDCGQVILRVFSATDQCGNTSTSNQVITIAASNGLPSCSFLSSPQGDDIGLNPTLTWTPSTNATGYVLTVTPQNELPIITDLDLGDNLSYGLTDLIPATTYSVQIVPYNNSGVAEACSDFEFITSALPSCNSMITPVSGSIVIPFQVDISWSASIGADGYVLSLGTTPGGIDILDHLAIDGLEYSMESLPEETTIYVSIMPFSEIGAAVDCILYSFNTGIYDGITSYRKTDGVIMFPNPNDGNGFNVKLSGDLNWQDIKSLVVTNSLGEVVYREHDFSNLSQSDSGDPVFINLISVAPGIYHVVLQGQRLFVVEKIVFN